MECLGAKVTHSGLKSKFIIFLMDTHCNR